MAALRPDWIDLLPPVKGKIGIGVPCAPLTWFRTGGAADVLFEPADAASLASVLSALPVTVPVTVIGLGSNLLVRDGGIEGLVIRLPKASFGSIQIEGDRIIAGAAAIDIAVASAAADAGLSGLEFLRGIPGCIGGAIAMNGGAYQQEMSDILVDAVAVNRTGETKIFPKEALNFSYRTCGLEPGWIFLAATLRGRPDDPALIRARMDEIARQREESQPLRTRTGGSTFRNPDPALSGGRKAWELIDAAGCRGLTAGKAQMSTKHCNFLLNLGGATAEDVETLGETVRERVLAVTGVELTWEIRRVGRKRNEEVKNGAAI